MNRNHRATLGELVAAPGGDDERKPSKSALKRHALALQSLGEQLAELKPERLAALPLSDAMREAIAIAQNIRPSARGGRRRQMQLIGKLMRDEEVAEIAEALDRARVLTQAQSLRMRAATDWRDRLVNGDATWADFLARYPDAAEFAKTHQEACTEQRDGRAPKAQRALYRAILKLIPE